MNSYFVQIGFAGECFEAFFVPQLETPLVAQTRVLVQTPRGVELGKVLATNATRCPDSEMATGLRILRPLTPDDEMLVARLQKFKRLAVRRCQALLTQSESNAVLLDVDQLFDGNTLVLHFLGPVDALGRELTDRVVAEYEAEVQSIRLSELMQYGCGPDCGTDSGGGCGSSAGCASCGIASACKK